MNLTGDRIKKLRKSHGFTQSQLAQKLGVSPSTIGMYEQGRRNPDSSMLVKIGETFSVTTDSLLGLPEKTCEAKDIIAELRERITNGKGVMLNGAPMSVEDREKLLEAIEIATGIIFAKKPRKERKK